MSFTYWFVLGTTMTVREVATELRDAAVHLDLLDPQTTPDNLINTWQPTPLGTIISVWDATPTWPWSPERDELGVDPTVRVTFIPNRDDGWEETGVYTYPTQLDDMIRIIDILLHRIPGDAVLNMNTEVIWLLRRAGELLLSEDPMQWPPDRLALITAPYGRATYRL